MSDAPIYVGKEFSSIREVEEALQLYENENHMKFVTGVCHSVDNENKKLARRGLPEAQHYKWELKHKNITYRCKFGPNDRIRTGRGIRTLKA